jgi:hypothetical protein
MRGGVDGLILAVRFWMLDASSFASAVAAPPPHCVLCRAGAMADEHASDFACATPDKSEDRTLDKSADKRYSVFSEGLNGNW